MSLFSRRSEGKKRRAAADPPESMWVRRGSRVIGDGPLEDLLDCRQVDTYQAIHAILTELGVRSVIDLGCNVSALGRLFRHWGYNGEYVGVDFNPHALASAARHLEGTAGRHGWVRANVRALPFADHSRECVVMKDVLEHMEDFRPFLSEAARIAERHLVVANFIPWGEGEPVIRREADGVYNNLYRRSDVLDHTMSLGWVVREVRCTLEKDARPNEVVVFRRTADLDHS